MRVFVEAIESGTKEGRRCCCCYEIVRIAKIIGTCTGPDIVFFDLTISVDGRCGGATMQRRSRKRVLRDRERMKTSPSSRKDR